MFEIQWRKVLSIYKLKPQAEFQDDYYYNLLNRRTLISQLTFLSKLSPKSP